MNPSAVTDPTLQSQDSAVQGATEAAPREGVL